MNAIWFERDPLPAFLDRLQHIRQLGPTGKVPEDSFAEIEQAEGVIASSYAYNDLVFARAPRLLVVSRLGIGYEKVDVAAATRYGIAICNAPDGPTVSTAEFAITLLMNVAKNVKSIEAEMQYGLATGTKSFFYKDYVGIELFGKQLGLIGLGRIGSYVARIALALGMRVAAYDPYILPENAPAAVTLLPSLADLLQTSDVVSLHLPLTNATEKLMNAERFAQMKRGAIFINTARGGQVDETALLEAVTSGHLFGAGLDVTDPEPPSPDNPLLHHPRIIVTPHIASGTQESHARIYDITLEQVFMVLRGERPPNLVNPEVWETVFARWQQLSDANPQR